MNYQDYLVEIEKDPEYIKGKEALRLHFALGNAVIHARFQRGWSQTELAHRAGTKQANISRIVSGAGNPTLQLVKKIMDVLDLDIQFVQHASASTTTTITYQSNQEQYIPAQQHG